MGKLVYCMNVSLDGYVEAPDGSLDWASVDDELHSWFNEHERSADAFLYGRRLYELMEGYWPTAGSDPSATPVMLEYARIYSATPRVVFSSALSEVTGGSRLVRGDVGEVLERLREEFPGDLHVGGPTLAAQFIARNLVDEYALLVHPVIVGGGTRFFPALDTPLPLRAVETRTFASGVRLLRYAVAGER